MYSFLSRPGHYGKCYGQPFFNMSCNAPIMFWKPLTHIRPMLNFCKNQSIELQFKSVDWFLYGCTEAFIIFWSIVKWWKWCEKGFVGSFFIIELPEANSVKYLRWIFFTKIIVFWINNCILNKPMVTASQP